MAQTARLPEPDFTDSTELRLYCNEVRRACHAMAMAMHMGAAELEAALSTIRPAQPGMFSRAMQRRRARRVAKHMRHAAECMIASSAAAVRTWGAFRTEYAPELSPVRGPRRAFRVVPE